MTKILKKCCVCGKEEKMYEKQLRCHACYVKAEKEKYLRVHCLKCCRHTNLLKNGLCRYCYKNSKLKPIEASKVLRCKNCGKLAKQAENNGLCKSCFENRDVIIDNLKLLEKWESF